MKKSMYFEGKGDRFEEIVVKLHGIPVDYLVELRGENTIFVFPHVPVRVYGELRGIFDCDCLPYKRARRINRRRKRQ